MDQVVGIRLVDKSRCDSENFRIEVWTIFRDESLDVAKTIRKYIDEHYAKAFGGEIAPF